MDKICFVIMGFGKKTDYSNGSEVDLDIIYNEVIKEVFSEKLDDYKLVRADEIAGSSTIDVSMYALLLKAELVIADITTLNPNAIYELGVRHALKPFSTIIMANDKCKLPFDLSHQRLLIYEDYQTKLSTEEKNKIKGNLFSFINATKESEIDSPLYTYLPNIKPPVINDEEYEHLVNQAIANEESISKMIEKAKSFFSNTDYLNAEHEWKKLYNKLENNEYIIQQWAISAYKSEHPSRVDSLIRAQEIINKLIPEKSLDFETLGITGAIYKRFYFETNKTVEYLEKAIHYYRKGYISKNDYYTGENYANCLNYKRQIVDISENEKCYLLFEEKKVRKDIVNKIEELRMEDEGGISNWIFATLAICQKVLGKNKEFLKNDKIFRELTTESTQIDTYEKTLKELIYET